MVRFVLRTLFTAAVALGLSHVLPGIRITDYWAAILIILVLSLLNTFVKPLLILFTLPLTVFTFGLFLFVINALMILLGSEIVKGFEVSNFWYALLFSIILSILNSFLDRKEREAE
ncbi:phage holin family protein [Parasegetibacter sp. NRK P23]|uniref:phage holin family protein n=1 Tax=Parasegetibacter sp. NRK P23 TaxID=2942999 RepID=UPI002044BDA1|nr:phage holin family protein [Parasegetibacter sp. NRK P23]MCM5529871.1 phage holin family protein [Parasegetibacter sp. NRK P23]